MDIPNLSTQAQPSLPTSPIYSKPIIVMLVVVSLLIGFVLSRIFPKTGTITPLLFTQNSDENPSSTDTISSADQLDIGKVYGNIAKTYKDTATGVIEKGNINGEGTHILNRAGGITQRASLTSSAVDLDLFVGKKVEVKGETNSSTKTSWLLDVGNIKILE